MNIISKTDSQEYYREYTNCSGIYPICQCGISIYKSNVVAAEIEKNIDGADVPTVEFFCSHQCANEWLDTVSTNWLKGLLEETKKKQHEMDKK